MWEWEKKTNKSNQMDSDRWEVVFTILIRLSKTVYIETGTNSTEKKEDNIANNKKYESRKRSIQVVIQ